MTRQIMTEPDETNDCLRGWCKTCYTESIARLCSGFAVVSPGGKAVIALPPLHPDMAYVVRKAARAHLAAHGDGDTSRHPDHKKRWR